MTTRNVNAKCFGVPALTYRELLAMALEKLGPAAAALKTREELTRALGLEPAAPVEIEPRIVTSDFFIARKNRSRI